MNDFINYIRFKIKLSADDGILYDEIHNSSDQADLSTSLSTLQSCCSKWQTVVHLKKTVAMTITGK